jgi:hypothetical protein
MASLSFKLQPTASFRLAVEGHLGNLKGESR